MKLDEILWRQNKATKEYNWFKGNIWKKKKELRRSINCYNVYLWRGSEYVSPDIPLWHKEYFELKAIERDTLEKLSAFCLYQEGKEIFNHWRLLQTPVSLELAPDGSTKQTLLKQPEPSISFPLCGCLPTVCHPESLKPFSFVLSFLHKFIIFNKSNFCL